MALTDFLKKKYEELTAPRLSQPRPTASQVVQNAIVNSIPIVGSLNSFMGRNNGGVNPNLNLGKVAQQFPAQVASIGRVGKIGTTYAQNLTNRTLNPVYKTPILGGLINSVVNEPFNVAQRQADFFQKPNLKTGASYIGSGALLASNFAIPAVKLSPKQGLLAQVPNVVKQSSVKVGLPAAGGMALDTYGQGGSREEILRNAYQSFLMGTALGVAFPAGGRVVSNTLGGVKNSLIPKPQISFLDSGMGGKGSPVTSTTRNALEKPLEVEPFKDTGKLSTNTLAKLEGKTFVKKQFIQDLTNAPDLKQNERELIRTVLDDFGDTVNVNDFAKKVKAELLPLEVNRFNNTAGIKTKYESISLPDDLRGNVANYKENIYESPVKTSSGDVHFSGSTDSYFGHARIEDMADNKTRRVIEVQSDLYQKGRLEREIPIDPIENAKKFGYKGEPLNEKQIRMVDDYKLRNKEIAKLQQYNDPTAHFRMIREEVKKAAEDGKTKLQFPTGETAMKIEGLGEETSFTRTDMPTGITLDDLVIGTSIYDGNTDWIITDVLGGGKFRAMTKRTHDDLVARFGKDYPFSSSAERRFTEDFDISGKVDTDNPIYKFYEKEVGKYLKNKYNAELVTDAQGVTWWEVDLRGKGFESKPVSAFLETKKLKPDPLVQEAKKYKSAEEFVDSILFRGEPGKFRDIKIDKRSGIPKTTAGYYGYPTTSDFDYATNRFAKNWGDRPSNEVRAFVPKSDAKILSDKKIILDFMDSGKEVTMYKNPNSGSLNKTRTNYYTEPYKSVQSPNADYEKLYLRAKKAGYDAVDLRGIDGMLQEKEVRIINPSAFIDAGQNLYGKTKSQLTDIWKKANKVKTEQSFLEIKKPITDLYNQATKNKPIYELAPKPNQADNLLAEARKYKSAEEFVKAQQPTKVKFTSAKEKAGYMGGHEAPMAEDINAPIWDLTGKYTGNKLYPDDIYSSEASRLYSSGMDYDPQAIGVLQSVKNRPNAKVTIYRAVPKDVKGEINPGDWVTLTKEYAKEHGESNLGGKFKIVKKDVYARDIFTDANSIQEFGYDPQPRLAPKDTPYDLLSKAYKEGKTDLHSHYQSQLTEIWNKANKVKTEQSFLEIKKPITINPLKSDAESVGIYENKLRKVLPRSANKPPATPQPPDKVVFREELNRVLGKQQSGQLRALDEAIPFTKVDGKEAEAIIDAIQDPKANISTYAKYGDYIKNIRAKFDELFKEAEDTGMDIGYRENYLPQIWKETETEIAEKMASVRGGFKFKKERKIPTYAEGKSLGLTPKYTHPAELVEAWVRNFERAKANFEFSQRLQQRGIIVPGDLVSPALPNYRAITAGGFPTSQNNIPFYAPKEIADQINRAFEIKESPRLLDITAKISSKAQDIGLSGGIPRTPINAFSVAQVVKEVTSGRIVSPIASAFRATFGDFRKYVDKNVDVIREIQESGTPLRLNIGIRNFLDQSTSERLFGKSFSEAWNKNISEATFGKFMPMLQVEFYKDVKAQALKSGIGNDEAIKVANKALRNFYGLADMATDATRSKVTSDIWTTLVFAPRYRESMIRFWVNNAKAMKNPTALENRQNVKFAIGAVITAVVYDLLNRQFNEGRGILDNPPGKEDKLLIPLDDGRTIGVPFLSSIATLPRTAFKIGKNVVTGDFKQAGLEAKALGSFAYKPLLDIIQNEDYFGNKIVDDDSKNAVRDRFAYLTKAYAHPYMRELLNAYAPDWLATKSQQNIPVSQRVMQAMELPIRFYKTSGIKGSYYYKAKDDNLKKLSTKERELYDKLNSPSEVDDAGLPVYNIRSEMANALDRLSNPKITAVETKIALDTARSTGEKPNPFYLLSPKQQETVLLLKTFYPGDKTKSEITNANKSWLEPYWKARDEFIGGLKAKGVIKENPSFNQRPQPTPQLQSKLDFYNTLPSGTGARSSFIRANADVEQFFNDSRNYTNSQRADLGLPLLAGYSSSGRGRKPKKLRAIKIKIPKIKTAKIKKPKKIKMYSMKKIKSKKIKLRTSLT